MNKKIKAVIKNKVILNRGLYRWAAPRNAFVRGLVNYRTADLQRLLWLLRNGVRGRCQIKFGMTNLFNRGGFTLIELLVVVLIIGILAAIALPQYQLAVARSRYATIKHLTNSIAQAEESYYLANGSYTVNFANLDIDMPSGKLPTSTSWRYNYDWGTCWLIGNSPWYLVTCERGDISVAYRRSLWMSRSPNISSCGIYGTTDLTDWRNKICELETKGKGIADEKENQIIYRYSQN